LQLHRIEKLGTGCGGTAVMPHLQEHCQRMMQTGDAAFHLLFRVTLQKIGRKQQRQEC
jgi:hypothetical protein